MSIYNGPIFLPLLIEVMLLLLLIVAGVVTMKKHRNRETTDELSALNNYKAGYITKYISIFVVAICISFTELVHNLVFIILEKVQYNPSFKLVMDIAKVFETTVEELFFFEE